MEEAKEGEEYEIQYKWGWIWHPPQFTQGVLRVHTGSSLRTLSSLRDSVQD